MANTGSKTGIVGIPNPTQRYTRWRAEEVYGIGSASTNVYIVNVGDTVLDVQKGMEFLVTAVDTLGIPTLEPLILNATTGVKSEDIALGTGPGLCSEGYRVYVNSSVIPSPFQIDTRMMIHGSENAYIKLFKGHDTSNTGAVISATINSAGVMVSENVELEAITIPHKTNTTYKKPKGGHITEGIEDGEVITCVIYTNAGIPSARFRLLAVNSEFIRNIDHGRKTVVSVDLITPFMSANDRTLVEFPIGMVTQSSSFLGKVTYNDGTYNTYPVDGTKFSLFGFDNFISSRLNDKSQLILNYRLSETETANNVKVVDDRRFVNKTYYIKNVESENRYNVKLYPILKWNSQNNRWNIEWWLYSLNRTAPINVTSFVEYGVNSPQFVGTKFGEAQSLSVAINLDRLGPSYMYFRHVEHFKITLMRPLVSEKVSAYYAIDFDSDSQVSTSTNAKFGVVGTKSMLEIGEGSSNLLGLLQNLYYNTEPLIYPYNEDVAPKPNKVKFTVGNWTHEIDIERIHGRIDLGNKSFAHGDTLEVEFLKVNGTSRLHLGRVGLILQSGL